MNDRFKLRVWDKYFNRYWTDEEVKNNIQWLLYPNNENIENVIIELCTGLIDKNGKLIYEGDTLKNIEQKIKVIFDEQRHCFMFEYQDTKAYKPISCVDVLDDNNLEVIGNIHENADLSENEE